MCDVPVRSLLGSLKFIAQRTRPDICASVNHLSRFQAKPNQSLWKATKNVLHYLRDTKEKKFIIKSEGGKSIDVYTDASQPSNDSKGVSGIVVKVNGYVISWLSRRQDLVGTSSAEVELYALSLGVDEGIYFQRLLKEFGYDLSIRLLCDNQTAIEAFRYRPKRSLKKIDLRTIHLMENVKHGNVEIQYIPGNIQIADVLTKPITPNKVDFVFQQLLGNTGEC